MWKHVAANGFSLLIVGFIGVAGLLAWGQQQYVSEGPLAEATYFEIAEGASLNAVSENLAAAGIIDNATIFRLGARYTERQNDLRFGNYEVPAGISMNDLMTLLSSGAPSIARFNVTYVIRGQGNGEIRLRERVAGSGALQDVVTFGSDEAVPQAYSDILESGETVLYRVSIPEGLTVWQIVEGLRAAEFLSDDLGEDLPQEGTLAPDTIEVARGESIAEILAERQARQTEILIAAWAGRSEGLPLESAEEALILASIIERETGVSSEREQVSGVFINRMEQGIRLQTDPTIIYGESEGRGFLGRGIRQSEIDNGDNPWNTYQIEGLPPTPIANPGRAAIEAAVNPADTDYIFFVADGSGGHAFAVTLDEHNRNVAAWRRIEAERAAQQN